MITRFLKYPIAKVALVGLGSSLAYVVLGTVIYFVYLALGGALYDHRVDEGLAALEIAFYTSYALHLVGTAVVAGVLARWTRAPVYPAFAFVVALLALAALPTIAYMSFLNVCENNVSFPLSGSRC